MESIFQTIGKFSTLLMYCKVRLYDSTQLCFGHALEATELMNTDARDNYLSKPYNTLGKLYNIQDKLHLALDYYWSR